MTEYEIIRRVPSGIMVSVYADDVEVGTWNVPADRCQTKSMLEAFLKQVSADRIRKLAVPNDVALIRGRQPLR